MCSFRTRRFCLLASPPLLLVLPFSVLLARCLLAPSFAVLGIRTSWVVIWRSTFLWHSRAGTRV